MRLRHAVLSLLFAGFAVAAIPVDRATFALTLPDGWRERKDSGKVTPSAEGTAQAAAGQPVRFFAYSRHGSCSLLLVPKRGRISVAWVADTLLQREAVRRVESNTFGGREGVGAVFYSRTPDGVHSVTRVLVFEERGYVAGLIATVSAMSETSATKGMSDQEPDLAAILGSLRLK